MLADLYIYCIALVLSLCIYVGLELSLAGCRPGMLACLLSIYLFLNECVSPTLASLWHFVVTCFPATKVKSTPTRAVITPPSHISGLTSNTSFPSSRYRATSHLHHRFSRCHSHVSSSSHITRHLDYRTQFPTKTTSPRTISDHDSGCLHCRVMCDV